MVCYKDASNVAKTPAEVAQKKKNRNNWPMVSFIRNGNEITTWMGHSFKTKNTKSRSYSLR